ncbi:MAG: uroporphyrinogen-III C-methyltransferase [Deltaproteobacteria bacterium]
MTGKVYLVGAGPGDPGLLTIKGRDCLAAAEVVFYDFLVNPSLLELAPALARKVLVGKRHGVATVEQAEIERMMVEEARAGRRVVRLKGGDPFVFGRGGEEAEALHAAGVSFEVVPGVTSAVAVPAYAGIPLTHRDYASSVTVVSGQSGLKGAQQDWKALASGGGTLVFLMAMLKCGEITSGLITAGMDPETPAALLRWGTLPRQQTLVSTLARISDEASRQALKPPVVLVVGAVVALSTDLSWYQSLPLFGRRIVVTRARRQAAQLAHRLEAEAAEVVEFPTIEILDPEDPAPLKRACQEVGGYDWLLLTSANGAQRFLDALAAASDIRALAGVAIATIGPLTREVVESRGLRVEAEPARYRGEDLAAALGEVAGRRILLPRATEAREILPETLRGQGAEVDVVPVYRTVVPGEPRPLSTLDGADMITFTSASTVRNFLSITGQRGREILASTATAAIGPVTAGALETESGITADVVADSSTVGALAGAISDFFANLKSVK